MNWILWWPPAYMDLDYNDEISWWNLMVTSSLSGPWLQGLVVKWMKYMKLCWPPALAHWILWWPPAYLDLDYKDEISWRNLMVTSSLSGPRLQGWVVKWMKYMKLCWPPTLAYWISWWPPAYLDLDYKDNIWNAWIVKLFQYFLFHVDLQLIWTWFTSIKCKNK